MRGSLKANAMNSPSCPSLPAFFFRTAPLAVCLLLTAHGQVFTSMGEFPVSDIKYVTSLRISGVSNHGSVVGTGYVGLFHSAFRWSQNNGFELLGSLAGGSTSWGNGISDDGNVIVGASTSASGVQATRWSQGGVTGLGSLPGYGSNATAISGDGQSIWGTSTPTNNEVASGPGWRRNSSGTLLGLGSDVSVPLDASANGSVVVGTKLLIPSTGTPARWDSSGNATLLGPPPDPQTGGAAYAVSSDGETIVGANLGTAVMWDSSGQMTPIGHTTPTMRPLYATDVNEDGSIIVGVSERKLNSTTFTSEAFVWTPEIGMHRLIDAVMNDPQLKAAMTGWTLYEANGLSANGRYITGWGLDPNGIAQGWFLDRGANPVAFSGFSPVPESDLYGLAVAIGLGGMMLRRRWRAFPASLRSKG